MERSNSYVGRREETKPQSSHRPLSAVYPFSETSHLHQRSADFSKSSASAVIIVKKSKKEPETPRRSASLLTHQPAKPNSKRYSCPALGITAQNLPESSSLSTSSSPPLIRTSTIAGPDPLGWRVRHKPGNRASRSTAGRLSLQIPLLDIFPDTKSQLSSNSSLSKVPKPSRRHNSDSLACLRSFRTTMPVAIEELCPGEFRPAHSMSDPGDVFEENIDKTEQNINKPPPVPIKSEMARQVAQLIAFSRDLSIENKPTHDETTKM